MRIRGFSKNKLSHWLSEVKYSNHAKILRKKIQINTCQSQRKRLIEAICLLMKFLVETVPEKHHRQFQGSRESGFRRKGRYGFYGGSR